MKYIYFFFIIHFILFEKYINAITSIELVFKKEPSTINDNFILANYYIDIFISFQIGNGKNKLEKMYLKSDTNEFMISNSSSIIANKNYDPEISSSSKKIVYLKSYKLKYTSKASIYRDKIFLPYSENKELNEFKDITFLYANNLNIDKYSGIIGLKSVEDEIKNAKVFPRQLYDLKYVNNANWMIKYTNDEEGYFYVGDILNDNIFSSFNIEKYRKTNAVVYGSYLSWDLTFSQIKSDSIILNGPMQAFLDFNFGLISCSNEYYNHIKKEFFNKYINEGKCSEKFYNRNSNNNIVKLESNFSYIVCDKSLKIKDFPDLIFLHSALDYIFTLTYEDCFITIKDKTYFLIINETEKNERWKIGKIFFKKYNIIFDHNAKTIGIYDDNYMKSNLALIIVEWIFVIALILVALFLAFTLFKRYRLNNYKFFGKKVKANELAENYDEFFENKSESKNVGVDAEQNEENKIIDSNSN